MRDAARKVREALGLESMPIGIAFVDEPPAGVPHAESVPAGCGFWKQAAGSVFYTEAADHAGCPIGLMTMGFPLSAEQEQEAMGLVGQMEGLGYLAAGEAGALPMVPGPTACIVYGPLDEFPVDPDTVLVLASSEQMMVLAEATDAFHLGASGLPLHGRPACSVIPRAASTGAPAASLGCAGMRTFTAVDPGMLLFAVNGADFPALADRVAALAEANTAMRAFYAEKAAGG
ncbi:MAG TPA: DUF169 domain-containing protein [Acidimicrobiia bacterium]|nr:DUF169 domain-containing protein [Acidimicrobiia bacterium]